MNLLLFQIRLQATSPNTAGQVLRCLGGLGITEWTAIIIKKPSEGELIEGMLRVFAVRRTEDVPSAGAVSTVTPGSWTPLLFNRVKVGCIHGVGNLRSVWSRLCTKIAGEIHLGKEWVSLYLSSPVSSQTLFS